MIPNSFNDDISKNTEINKEEDLLDTEEEDLLDIEEEDISTIISMVNYKNYKKIIPLFLYEPLKTIFKKEYLYDPANILSITLLFKELSIIEDNNGSIKPNPFVRGTISIPIFKKNIFKNMDNVTFLGQEGINYNYIINFYNSEIDIDGSTMKDIGNVLVKVSKAECEII